MKNTLTLLLLFLLAFCLSAQIQPVEWENFYSLPTSVSSFSAYGGKVWATANGSLFYSEDEGISWTRHPDFLFDDLEQVVAGEFGVTVSRHRGESYSPPYSSQGFVTLYHSEDGNSFEEVHSILTGTHHYGGWYSKGIFKKSDSEVCKMQSSTDLIFETSFASVSTNGGATWGGLSNLLGHYGATKTSVYNDSLSLTYFTPSNDSLVFEIYEEGNVNGEYYEFPLLENFNPVNSIYRFEKIISIASDGQVAVSEDEGTNWTLYQVDLLADESISTVTFTENSIGLMSTNGLREMSYTDLGNAPLTLISSYPNPEYIGNDIYFATENAIFYSDFSGAYRKATGSENFEIINDGLGGDAKSMIVAGNHIWAERSRNYSSQNVHYTSDDLGENWTIHTDPVLYTSGNDILVLGGFGNSSYIQAEGGIVEYDVVTREWEVIIPDVSVVKAFTAGDDFFVITSTSLYFFKADGTIIESEVPVSSSIQYVWLNDEIFAFKEGIRYGSIDFGQTWIESEYSGNIYGTVYATENGLIACGQSMYRSIDAGLTWVYSNSFHQYVSYGNYSPSGKLLGFYDGLAVYNYDEKMYFTANEGADKLSMPVPFENYYGYVMTFNSYVSAQPEGAVDAVFKDGYLILCTQEQGIFRTPYAGIISQLPTEAQLNNVVTGRLYKDIDSSCSYTDSDLPLVGKVISIGPGHGITNGVGRYAATLPPTAAVYNYNTAPVTNYETICNNIETGTVETEYLSIENIDVAFRPIPGLTDAKITLMSGTLRPGFTATAHVRIENIGNEPLADLAAIWNYDTDYLSVISAESGTEIGLGEWSFPVNLDLNEYVIYDIELQVSETTPLGTEITYLATIDNEGDHNTVDNEDELTMTVTGSYDPNDKVAFHDDEVLPFTTNELIYRIRFQNTGTDTAFTVKVLDTLSQNLDILSFEMLEASHEYELKIKDPRILEWTFNNILLVDSLTNEPLSHGHIFFKINTTADLAAGENVLNDAAIYFDFNEPVITNEEEVLIEKGTIQTNDLVTICTGEMYEGHLILQDTVVVQILPGTIYDTLQATIVDALDIYENNIPIYGTPGTEIGGVTAWSDTSFTQILETWQGCDSIINYQFLLNTVEIYSELDLCIGDEYNGTIVNENFTAIDTIHGTFIDSIMITEVTAYPVYSSETAFAISSGSYVAGVQVLTDTMLQFNYTTAQGCDSLIIYDISIITSNENQNEVLTSAVLSPNPTEGSTYLSLFDVLNKEVSISIYDVRGQKIKELMRANKVIENDFRTDLDTNNLPSGLYYVYVKVDEQLQCLKLVKI